MIAGAGAGAVEGDPYGDNVSNDDADMNSKSPTLLGVGLLLLSVYGTGLGFSVRRWMPSTLRGIRGTRRCLAPTKGRR